MGLTEFIIKEAKNIFTDHQERKEEMVLKEKTVRDFLSNIDNGEVMVCIKCSAFVDKDETECPFCWFDLGQLDQGTLALSVEDIMLGKESTIKRTGEGRYSGRLSKGNELVFDFDDNGQLTLWV